MNTRAILKVRPRKRRRTPRHRRASDRELYRHAAHWAGDPFAAFVEWAGKADEKAYADL